MDLDVIGPCDLGIASSADDDDEEGEEKQNGGEGGEDRDAHFSNAAAQSKPDSESVPSSAKRARVGEGTSSPPPSRGFGRDSPSVQTQAPAAQPPVVRIPPLPDAITFFLR